MSTKSINPKVQTLMKETEKAIKEEEKNEEKPKEEKTIWQKTARWIRVITFALMISALFAAFYLLREGYSFKNLELQLPVQGIFRIKQQEPITLKAPVRSKTAAQIVSIPQTVVTTTNPPKAQN